MTLSLLPPPQIITFDCYGTLVQWRERFHESIGAVLHAHGAKDIDPFTVLATFSKHSSRMGKEKPHRIYKQILRDAFTAAYAEFGIAPSEPEIESMVDTLKKMGPHPETTEVLKKLRTRYKLGIFTNSDDDLIVYAVRSLGVPIDFVITAEQAGAYKPARRIFEYGHAQMGVTTSDVVHVAQSLDLDMQACHELGVRAIWINRLGLKPNLDWKPYEELSDLRGVPAMLGIDD